MTQLSEINFIDVSGIITFTSNTSNIGYVNETLKLGLTYSKSLSSLDKQNIKCKLGDELIPSIVTESFFLCFVNSSVSSVKFISLWYVYDGTLNGEFKLSSTTLPVIFIGNLHSLFNS
jgi:hypothetical protein